jgi:tetratricopeptide (TPR) repeat protein
LSTIHNLANIYCYQNHYTEAKTLYERVLAVRKEKLGAEHPDTLATIHNLAYLYARQKHYTEAEKLYKQVLVAREELLGEGHLCTLATMHDLAYVYETRGRYAKAKNLARIRRSQGRRTEADQALYEQVSKVREPRNPSEVCCTSLYTIFPRLMLCLGKDLLYHHK